MKVFSNAPVKGYKGDDILIPMGDGLAPSGEFRHTLRWILNNAPIQTQDDSIQGMRLAQAIDAAEDKDNVEVEEGVHDWLKKVAEKITPTLFRINGNILYKHICDGFEKPHQPKEKVNGRDQDKQYWGNIS